MDIFESQNLDIEIHKLTKKALKGDIEALEVVIDFLSNFNVTLFKTVAYLIVYQVIMNLDPDTAKECMKCDGLCCRTGSYIPLYSFDLEDLRNVQLDINKAIKCNGEQCYLQRPCIFQVEWRCTIHKFKPYACLSYPFASEEVQKPVLVKKAVEIPPNPVVPDICLAAKKVWSKISNRIDRFKKEYGRKPEPIELFKYL